MKGGLNMLLRYAAIGVVLLTSGCGPGPGSPLIRQSPDDGYGPLINGCQNVSHADKTENFVTDFYLTTWGSAAREGAAEGFKKGLEDAEGSGMDAMLAGWGYSQLPKSAIFCRSYQAEPHQVLAVTAYLLESLGYHLVFVSKEYGKLETDFVYRQRSFVDDGPPLHKWKDRFVITVDPLAIGGSTVQVFRDIHISRCNRTDGCSDFMRATSVGHNEAAILNLIHRELRDG